MHFIVINRLKHQENRTSHIQQFTPNTSPLIPILFLWYKTSWLYLIIMLIIMVMYRFTLHIIPCNIPMSLFQTRITLKLNHLMIMKYTIFFNSSTHNIMMIFWMLISRCSRLDSYSLLHQNSIQYKLCCFVKMQGGVVLTNFLSHFSMFFPIQSNVKFSNGNMGYAQVIGIILCHFPKLSHYIPFGASLLLSVSPSKYHIIDCT